MFSLILCHQAICKLVSFSVFLVPLLVSGIRLLIEFPDAAMCPAAKSPAALGHSVVYKGKNFLEGLTFASTAPPTTTPARPWPLQKVALAGQALPLHLPQELMSDSVGCEPYAGGRALPTCAAHLSVRKACVLWAASLAVGEHILSDKVFL